MNRMTNFRIVTLSYRDGVTITTG